MRLGFRHQGKTAAVALFTVMAALSVAGCGRFVNGPKTAHNVETRPTAVMNFDELYSANCAACHGQEGKSGPAIGFNNPVYLAVANDAVMVNYTLNGGPSELMPAFGRSAGGLLTDAQIHVIVQGIRQRWAKPAELAGVTLPPYAASHPGDVNAGGQVYQQACARCHGEAGAQGTQASPGESGAITNPVYLSLVSDQGLRSIVIAGRPDLKMPDFRNDIPGHPLTDAQITDVVAWLSSRRPPMPVTHPGSNLQPDAVVGREPNTAVAPGTAPLGPHSPLHQKGVEAMPGLHPRPHAPAQPQGNKQPSKKPAGQPANGPGAQQ